MPEQNVNLPILIKKYITTEFITIITFLIYSWGYLYNYFYYQEFGINITNYLTLQETFIDTLSYIFLVSILIVIFNFIGYYISFYHYLLNKESRIRKYISVKKGIINKYLYNFYETWVTVDYLLCIIITLYYILPSDRLLYHYKYLAPTLGISVVFKMFILNKYINTKISRVIPYLYILTIFIVVLYFGATKQSESVINLKNPEQKIIGLSNGITYTTNNDLYYIGETSTTIFLFDRSKNNTIIINKSNVIQTQLINQATIKLKKYK